ncbi:hypothetical protein QAD02_021088 [Eretmocerus hayati]|uniref:Uncharacterized protein n=1 Tax=Eretmocerus hayati TaxID=131215 RepID=A0ACC2PPG2_9HYME|nr:hypothetical protein QAD02_021088 [Eretmocerus hayati]
MRGCGIPPSLPPFMPPNATSTASIREVRDSKTERDQRTTAGRSHDSSSDDTEYIRRQRDRLQGLRVSQTTNQVPSNTQAPPIIQTPVGTGIQETSQGAYAGTTRHRPESATPRPKTKAPAVTGSRGRPAVTNGRWRHRCRGGPAPRAGE